MKEKHREQEGGAISQRRHQRFQSIPRYWKSICRARLISIFIYVTPDCVINNPEAAP